MIRDLIDRTNLLQYIAPQDLKAFGLIPEIIGRLPVLTYLESLDRETCNKNTLNGPKNPIVKQYEKLFRMDGIELTFDKKVLDFIVDKAVEFKLGARGLRSICEAIMVDAMYEMPSTKETNLNITLNYAKKRISSTNMKKLRVA